MTRLVAASLIGSIATACGAAVLYDTCPGCIERNRVNARCEWRGDTASRLDVGQSADRRHLSLDAQLAEDLAIRYADEEYRRRSGYEGHGGLIANGEFRNRCLARLVASIEQSHGVTSEDVRVARGRRNAAFDAGVALVFLPMYLLFAAGFCAGLRRRFSSDRRRVIFVAAGLASLAGSFIGVQVLELWLSVWEIVRVGNGHMSVFRAATASRWSQNAHAAEFIAGVLSFWLVGALVLRTGSRDAGYSLRPNPYSL